MCCSRSFPGGYDCVPVITFENIRVFLFDLWNVVNKNVLLLSWDEVFFSTSTISKFSLRVSTVFSLKPFRSATI